MKLSRTQKIIIGVFTLLPFILFPYIIYEIIQFIFEAISMSEEGEPEPAAIFAAILSFIFPIIFLSLLSFGLLIFYIIHAVSNKAIESTERVIWIIIFIFFSGIAFPIYWFIRLWNESETNTTTTSR
jgi:hypothetical protein